MKKTLLVALLVALLAGIIFWQTKNNNHLPYLNQTPPGLTPEVFAPGIISTDNEYEFGAAFSKEADKFYYAIRLNEDWKAEIRYVELQNGKWTSPKKIGLDGKYSYNDPYISQSEDKIYFISDRPKDGKGDPKDIDLWYIQKTDTGWSEPINAGEAVNSEKDEFYISISNTGTIYFASNIHTTREEDKWNFDIYSSKSENGKFQTPVVLSESINSEHFECDAFVSPDESYMIFCSSRPGGYGQGDLYISFRIGDNKWTKAKNMGKIINSGSHDFCPFVTRDGKYFFYSSGGTIYWVDSKIIDTYR